MARTRGWICAIAAAAACGLRANAGPFEVPLPDADRAKLDQFAVHAMAKADKSFTDKMYRQAAAEYEAFIQEFPKSPANPYALFQKARSVHLGDEPLKAIRVYEEVLDYFPSVLRYAVPALFCVSECHLQNRDLPNAMKVWMEMATDPDYRRHPKTAEAINRLARTLMQQGRSEEAIKFYRQGTVDFRATNPEQAMESMNALIDYYVAVAPNEPELRKFYKEAGGFERKAAAPDPNADVTQDRLYWQRIWERAWAKAATFTVMQTDLKRKLLAYWAEAFKGRFPDWKEFQEQLARFTREAAANP